MTGRRKTNRNLNAERFMLSLMYVEFLTRLIVSPETPAYIRAMSDNLNRITRMAVIDWASIETWENEGGSLA